ncbi:PorV/PorQ family protein [Candidatus Poribacteria bacterium]|nr:PorV/PorQ family protein [Candidatus Poribacteria bacterium]
MFIINSRHYGYFIAKNVYLLLLLISLLTCGPIALSSATTPGAFYFIGSGARARALGNAFVAVADDASAVYWNPAGIDQLESPVLMVMDRITTLDTNYVNLAGVLPVNDTIGTVGFNVIFFSVDDIPIFDDLANPGGELTDKEWALAFSYAYGIRGISFGVNFKALYQRIGDGQGNEIGVARTRGTGIDLAILYQMTENFRVGVVLHEDIKLRDLDDAEGYTATIPRSITTGLFYQIPLGSKHRWRLMADFEQRRKLPLRLHLGSELALYRVSTQSMEEGTNRAEFFSFSLRAGLNDVVLEPRGAEISFSELFRSNLKPTLGIGGAKTLGETLLKLDYAASFEEIGVRHFLSISTEF